MQQPFLLVWLVLLAGCGLIWFPRSARAGRIATTAGVVLLSCLGYGVPLEYARSYLESRYAPVDTAAVRDVHWVVVLGGGYNLRTTRPLSSRPSPPALYRVVEGIVRQRQNPSRVLIFTGSSRTRAEANAIAGAELAKALGVPPDRIIVDVHPVSTSEEVGAVLSHTAGEPFLLVTSALHMPRAMLLFQRHGGHPIAAPTQRVGTYAVGSWFGGVFPSAGRVAGAGYVLHELLGLAAIRLFGWETR